MLGAFFSQLKFFLVSFSKLKFRNVAASVFVPTAYFGSMSLKNSEVDKELKKLSEDIERKLDDESKKDLTPFIEFEVHLGQYSQYFGRFQEALGYYKKAQNLLEETLFPKYSLIETIYLGIINCLRALGKDLEAAGYLEKMADMSSVDSSKFGLTASSNYTKAAKIYEKYGDLKGAERCYEKILFNFDSEYDLPSFAWLSLKSVQQKREISPNAEGE